MSRTAPLESITPQLRGLKKHFSLEVMPHIAQRIDPSDIAGSQRLVVDALIPAVNQYRAAASVLASRNYVRQRSMWIPGHYKPYVAPPAPAEQIATIVDVKAKSLRLAQENAADAESTRSDLSTADVSGESSLSSAADGISPDGGFDDTSTVSPEDVEALASSIDSSMGRLILNGARQTTIGNVNQDVGSNGWSRITAPGACAFCIMLASRGFVYREEQTAGFQAHDDCECEAQPRFKGQPPQLSPVALAAREVWSETQTGGMSNSRAMSNFRAEMQAAREDGRWDKYLEQAGHDPAA